jgi:hypothetical protein
MRRPGAEDPGGRAAGISARRDLQEVPPREVQPGQDQRLVTSLDPAQRRLKSGRDIDACLGSTLVSLQYREGGISDFRDEESDGNKPDVSHH